MSFCERFKLELPVFIYKSEIAIRLTNYRDGSPEYMAVFVCGEQYDNIDNWNKAVKCGSVIIL